MSVTFMYRQKVDFPRFGHKEWYYTVLIFSLGIDGNNTPASYRALTSERGNLYIAAKRSQKYLVPKCPLKRGSTVLLASYADLYLF